MKRIARLLFPLLLLPCYAQVAVSPIVQPHVTFVDASGNPCAGCKLSSFNAGTTTPLATYTDASGVSVNTNPIILDAAGGANIWLSNSSYKLILKDASGTTIWTVDQVKGGGGLGGVCGPAGAIQVANSAANGLTCDATITINTTAHTLNVGTITPNHVTIGALGTPTAWTFDTTSPTTALSSMNGISDGSGTTTPDQIAFTTSTAHVLRYSTGIPTGIFAATQGPGDNSTRLATTEYVENPGPIGPTLLALNGGSTLSNNQGNGAYLQHSTGTVNAGHVAVFDASGNTVDGGAVTGRICNANGCYRIEADGTIEQWGTVNVPASGTGTNTATITFPFAFTTTANLAITIATVGVAGSGDPADPPGAQLSSASTTDASVFMARFIQAGEGGGSFDNTIILNWHAIGN